MKEGELQSALLLEAPKRIPRVRLFRRNVGTVRIGERVMRFGVAGQCDLYALVQGGLHIELELKAADGRLSTAQHAWAKFCTHWSVPYLLLRAEVDEPVPDTAARWCEQIASCSSSIRDT